MKPALETASAIAQFGEEAIDIGMERFAGSIAREIDALDKRDG